MFLRDLAPEFMRRSFNEQQQIILSHVSRAEAQGLWFLCPKCYEKNNGPVGTHMILCWQPDVPADWQPGPGRWWIRGTGIDDLTLEGVHTSSVLLPGEGCGAHFHIRNGEIVWC